MATRLKDTDVVVIGLGAAGGVAVLPLAQAGIDVVGLEAGTWLTKRDFAPDELRNNVRDWPMAVQKAQELKPDLILLDIGLPKIDGLECARQIRLLATPSKIIFVSQESSTDVVQEALKLASAYVVKTKITSELLAAIETVLAGNAACWDQMVDAAT